MFRRVMVNYVLLVCLVLMTSVNLWGATAGVSKNSPSDNVTFKNSSVAESRERKLKVGVSGVLKRVDPGRNDLATPWQTGTWSNNVSSSVTYTGLQKAKQKTKSYQPKFSGRAGPAPGGGGEGGTNQDYEWKVNGKYELVEVGIKPIPCGNIPDLDPGIMCTNAQAYYRTCKWITIVKPSGAATITVVAGGVFLNGKTNKKINVNDGQEFTVLAAKLSKGDYSLKISYNADKNVTHTMKGKIFRFKFDTLRTTKYSPENRLGINTQTSGSENYVIAPAEKFADSMNVENAGIRNGHCFKYF